MPTLEAPTIDTFQPVRAYSALGVGYVSLRNPDGVQLELSEPGAAAVDQNPDLAALLPRMGDFIARHGRYRATIDVTDREPGDILRVGENPREMQSMGYDRVHLASVYHPDAAEDVVIKAYDYHRRSARFQFYLGAWLHRGLAAADDGLDSPAQLAMFQTPRAFGHKTAVMDFVPGKNLYDLISLLGSGDRYPQDINDVQRIALAASKGVRQKIGKIMGWRGLVIANDVQRNLRNVMDTDPETVTPDNMLDRQLTVIDQPAVRLHSLPLLALVRHLPPNNQDGAAQGLTPGYRPAA